MVTTITLSELLDRDVELTCADAVALVQLMMFEADITSARAPYGPPSLDNIALAADGSVHCMHTAATPSLVEAAVLLQALVARSHDRLPGGLRYAIGRALLEVEAPPFDTLEDFSAALTRFESGDRAERVSQLFNLGTGRRSPVPVMPAPASVRTERRRHEPNSAELRRQLREADLWLYEARQRAASASAKATRSRRLKRAPIAACMAAGIALVAVGELSPSARAKLAAIRHVSQPTPARAATPVLPDPSRTSPPMPVAASDVATAQMAESASSQVQNTERPASRTRPSVKSRRAAASTIKSSRSAKRSTDRDRGVIARIRFEWDNPFR
jgi:hypothetical protein